MSGEERDKALYDVITTIWKAYRTDCKAFNDCFDGLYKKYDDKAVINLIVCMGMGMAPAVRAKVEEEHGQQANV